MSVKIIIPWEDKDSRRTTLPTLSCSAENNSNNSSNKNPERLNWPRSWKNEENSTPISRRSIGNGNRSWRTRERWQRPLREEEEQAAFCKTATRPSCGVPPCRDRIRTTWGRLLPAAVEVGLVARPLVVAAATRFRRPSLPEPGMPSSDIPHTIHLAATMPQPPLPEWLPWRRAETTRPILRPWMVLVVRGFHTNSNININTNTNARDFHIHSLPGDTIRHHHQGLLFRPDRWDRPWGD
mmetsp:Transcript_20360/g.41686  ORF Transcript_20360/g.41686 Transcript_20360/m.41686 type:complete len:239 (-) Transcript_20360:1375-2091(-)